MNFTLIGDFVASRDFDKSRHFVRNGYCNDTHVGVYSSPEGGNDLCIIRSSVPSSFWKIFNFINSSGTLVKCIFIPDPYYIFSCLEFKDIDSLKLCKEWLDYIEEIGMKPVISYYNRHMISDDTLSRSNEELLELIPKRMLPRRIWDGYVYGLKPNILTSLYNYNPETASKFFSSLGQNSKFECRDTIEYVILKNSINHSNIEIVLKDPCPGFIMIASQIPECIAFIERRDILDYIMNANIDNFEQLLRLPDIYGRPSLDDNDHFSGDQLISARLIMEACIKKYGSVSNARKGEIKSMKKCVITFDEVFEFQRPLFEHLSTRKIIKCNSPMFSILFPDIPVKYDNDENMEYYSLMNVQHTKEEFLFELSQSYNPKYISRLYELYIDGSITAEDIVNSGLHYMYAACHWMINKVVKSKRSLRD